MIKSNIHIHYFYIYTYITFYHCYSKIFAREF